MIGKNKISIEHSQKKMRRQSNHITTRKTLKRKTTQEGRQERKDKKIQDVQKTMSKLEIVL